MFKKMTVLAMAEASCGARAAGRPRLVEHHQTAIANDVQLGEGNEVRA